MRISCSPDPTSPPPVTPPLPPPALANNDNVVLCTYRTLLWYFGSPRHRLAAFAAARGSQRATLRGLSTPVGSVVYLFFQASGMFLFNSYLPTLRLLLLPSLDAVSF